MFGPNKLMYAAKSEICWQEWRTVSEIHLTGLPLTEMGQTPPFFDLNRYKLPRLTYLIDFFLRRNLFECTEHTTFIIQRTQRTIRCLILCQRTG